MLEVHNVSKSIGRRPIIRNLSFTVQKGEIFGFLGPNGSGKTTTIRMICGLVPVDNGSIHVAGFDLANERISALKKLGAIVENPDMYGYLTGYENLQQSCRLIGASQDSLHKSIHDSGLGNRIHDKVRTYSLGMKQRLGLANALLGEPALIVLDEPTNGLDPIGILELRKLLLRLVQERGLTIFLSSHHLAEVEQLCHRAAILKEGRLVSMFKPDVKHNPLSKLEMEFVQFMEKEGDPS